MQYKNPKKEDRDEQERKDPLLSVLLTIWRNFRSLIMLSLTLIMFFFFPTFLIMGMTLDWSEAAITVTVILSAASVLSIPAALCGASDIAVSMIRQKTYVLYRDFFRAFKENYLKALLGGAFYFILMALLFLSGYSAHEMFGNDILFVLLAAVCISFGLIIFAASLYFYTMLVMVNQPLKVIIRNSFLIVPACWKRSLLALFATLFVTAFLLCFTFTTAICLAGFLFLAVYVLTVNFAVYPGILRLKIFKQAPKIEIEEDKPKEEEKKLSWDEDSKEEVPETGKAETVTEEQDTED